MKMKFILDSGDVVRAVRIFAAQKAKLPNEDLQWADIKVRLHPIRFRRKHTRMNPIKEVEIKTYR